MKMAVVNGMNLNKIALSKSFTLLPILGVVNDLLINSFRNQHLAKELLKDSELAAVMQDNKRARIGDDFHGIKAIRASLALRLSPPVFRENKESFSGPENP